MVDAKCYNLKNSNEQKWINVTDFFNSTATFTHFFAVCLTDVRTITQFFPQVLVDTQQIKYQRRKYKVMFFSIILIMPCTP